MMEWGELVGKLRQNWQPRRSAACSTVPKPVAFFATHVTCHKKSNGLRVARSGSMGIGKESEMGADRPEQCMWPWA